MLQVWETWLDHRRWARRGMAVGLLMAGAAALAIWASVAVFAASAPTTSSPKTNTLKGEHAEYERTKSNAPVTPPKPLNSVTPVLPDAEPLINLTDAWTRATPGSAKNAAVYLSVVNDSAIADNIVGVEVGAAEHASLHTTEMTAGNMAQMKDAEKIPVPASSTVAFAPGGKHIMLEALRAPLKEGESFLVTLQLEKAGRQTVSVRVMSANATGPDKHSAVADKLLNAEVTPAPSATQKK